MHEVVLRRYRRVLEAGGPFPDLVLIDGGKGQLSAAYAALEELGLGRLIAVGIAKKEELLFTRDREDAIALPRESPALLLIQRIRDEAHRFAVTFHRQSRREAGPAIGSGRSYGHWPKAPKGAVDRLRQRRRRAPGDARRARPSGRGQSRRRRADAFRVRIAE